MWLEGIDDAALQEREILAGSLKSASAFSEIVDSLGRFFTQPFRGNGREMR
jgi:hypothetical protein